MTMSRMSMHSSRPLLAKRYPSIVRTHRSEAKQGAMNRMATVKPLMMANFTNLLNYMKTHPNGAKE